MSNSKYTKPRGSYISHMSDMVKKNGGINLAQGLPGYKPPIELIAQFDSTINENIHQYAPGNGNLKLLDLIRDHYKKYINLSLNDILIVQGATEALSLLYTYMNKLFGQNFTSVAIDPVYESYKNLPEIFNSTFIPIQLENGRINLDKLEQLVQKENVKVFFLGSPGNPYGKMLSKKEIQSLIALAEKYNFYIFFDAVYKDLYYSEAPYQPLEELHENIFYINSFSKSLSITGWRIGYLFAHPKHMSNINAIHDYTGLCASSVLQEVLSKYLKDFNFGETYSSTIRKNIIANYMKAAPILNDLGFQIPKIDGGYFIWAELPSQFQDGFKFAVDLYENEKVAIIPGEHFSKNSLNYVRINLAREKEELETALKKISEFIKNKK